MFSCNAAAPTIKLQQRYELFQITNLKGCNLVAFSMRYNSSNYGIELPDVIWLHKHVIKICFESVQRNVGTDPQHRILNIM